MWSKCGSIEAETTKIWTHFRFQKTATNFQYGHKCAGKMCGRALASNVQHSVSNMDGIRIVNPIKCDRNTKSIWIEFDFEYIYIYVFYHWIFAFNADQYLNCVFNWNFVFGAENFLIVFLDIVYSVDCIWGNSKESTCRQHDYYYYYYYRHICVWARARALFIKVRLRFGKTAPIILIESCVMCGFVCLWSALDV